MKDAIDLFIIAGYLQLFGIIWNVVLLALAGFAIYKLRRRIGNALKSVLKNAIKDILIEDKETVKEIVKEALEEYDSRRK